MATIIESELKRSGAEFVDGDGKTYRYLYVASACTKNTPYAYYLSDTSGRALQSAVPAASAICRIGVATETLTAAGYSKFQFGGQVDALVVPTITGVAGQTLKIASAAVAAGGAATVTPDDFAIVEVVTSTTALKVHLLNREITPS